MKSTEAIEAFRNKCIFITGGTGFLGRPLVDTLLNLNSRFALGMEVIALTRGKKNALIKRPHWQRASSLELVEGDVQNFKIDRPIDMVIHGATSAGTHANDDDSMIAAIVEGTANIVRNFSRSNLKRFVFLSSGAVYGSRELNSKPIMEEEGVMGHISAYGRAKIEAENRILEAFEPAVCARSARLFAFSGPELPMDGPFALGQFFAQVLAEVPIVVKGSGRSVRSFLDLEDLNSALLALLVRDDFSHARCNIGSNEQVTVAELAHMIDSICRGKGVRIENGGGQDSYYLPNVERMTHGLGVIPVISLDASLRRVWSALNPKSLQS